MQRLGEGTRLSLSLGAIDEESSTAAGTTSVTTVTLQKWVFGRLKKLSGDWFFKKCRFYPTLRLTAWSVLS